MRENEELRGLLNCGHTRDSAYVVRTVGDDHTPKQFFVWGAKAIAGIGHLADTLMDRSITLELRRKLSHEQVDKLRHAEADLFDALKSKLARWSEDNADAVRVARPVLPDSLHDRAADNWEPLFQIAEVAGGALPDLARRARSGFRETRSNLKAPEPSCSPTFRRCSRCRSVQRIFIRRPAARASFRRGKAVGNVATVDQGHVAETALSNRLGEYSIKSNAQIRIGYDAQKGFTS